MSKKPDSWHVRPIRPGHLHGRGNSKKRNRQDVLFTEMKNGPMSWDFKYANRELEIIAVLRKDDRGRTFMSVPMPELAEKVVEALRRKYGDMETEGRFNNDGLLESDFCDDDELH